ncbi:MAG: hypothetical protein HQM13_00245 [SAR324 cluster bacterium]|nr:hypothetical protein [SAR324 cluster bacterium]
MRRFVVPPLFCLMTLLVLSAVRFDAQAQIIFQLAPDPPIRPWLLLSSGEEYVPESPVISSIDPSLETPSLSEKSQTLNLNLGILQFSKKKTSVTYRKSETLAKTILSDSNETLQISRGDLPASLFQEGGTLSLGIPLGENTFHFQGGASMTTDKKDISNEDYNSSNAVFFRIDPKAKTSWTVGFFQRTFLGDISPVYPLAEVAFDDSDYNMAMGAIHFPEYPDLIVVPFFRLTIKTKMELALDLVFPVRASLYTVFLDDWSLELSLEQRNEYFRLSRKIPWDSTILQRTHLVTKMEVAYHLFGIFLLKAGIGNFSSRKNAFLDEDLDQMAAFSLETKPQVNGHISLATRFQFE